MISRLAFTLPSKRVIQKNTSKSDVFRTNYGLQFHIMLFTLRLIVTITRSVVKIKPEHNMSPLTLNEGS